MSFITTTLRRFRSCIAFTHRHLRVFVLFATLIIVGTLYFQAPRLIFKNIPVTCAALGPSELVSPADYASSSLIEEYLGDQNDGLSFEEYSLHANLWYQECQTQRENRMAGIIITLTLGCSTFTYLSRRQQPTTTTTEET